MSSVYVAWKKRRRGVPKHHPKLGDGRIARRSLRSQVYRRLVELGEVPQECHLAAILVENRRIGGKARQVHIAYLGGITTSAMQVPAERAAFWEDATACLDELGDRITGDERAAIEAAVAERVPRTMRSAPTPPSREQEMDVLNMVATLVRGKSRRGRPRMTGPSPPEVLANLQDRAKEVLRRK